VSELRAVRDRGISNPVSIYLVSIYLVLALATILAGLGWRLLRLGLPAAVVKWGGSVLWAAMVYWLTAALMPRSRVLPTALTAGAIAGLVECVRLYHSPGLDAFRLTLAGKLLLGRVFSPWHPVVYWAAIAIAAAFDRGLLRGLERAQP
jgi:hypothetical protein